MLYNVMVALAVSFYSISEVLHVLMAVNLYIARIQGELLVFSFTATWLLFYTTILVLLAVYKINKVIYRGQILDYTASVM